MRFEISHLDPEALGTCDAVICTPSGSIVVMDLKYGQGHIVEVDGNKQLLYYALGAFYDLPKADRADVWDVELVIVQPRARGDEPVKRAMLGRSDLLDFEKGLKDAIGRVRSGATDTEAGPWCKWCKAKPVCPTLRADVSRKAGLEFGAIETEPVVLPEPAAMGPDRIAALLKNAEDIKDWTDSIMAYAYHMAERGYDVPGYKLVQGRANRRWIDEATVKSKYEAEFGERLFNRKLKSPAQIEKLFGKDRANELEELFTRPEGKRTLVPIDDRRDALLPVIQEEFSSV